MSTNHCPKCDAIIEFAQCDSRICDNCGWSGDWQKLTTDYSDEVVSLLNKLESIANNVSLNSLAFRHVNRLTHIATIIRNRLENEQNRGCVDKSDNYT